MGVKVQTAQFSAKTTTGTQDLTIAGLGSASEIKGVVIWMSAAVTNGTPVIENNMSIGITDFTTDWCISANDEDAKGTVDSTRTFENSIIRMQSEGSTGTIISQATTPTAITDGVRITWGTVTGAANKITVLFLVGTDTTCVVGMEDVGNSVDNVNDITTVGFSPKLVFILNAWRTSSGSGGFSEGFQGFGWGVDNGASIDQRSWSWTTDNGEATSAVTHRYSETHAGDFGWVSSTTRLLLQDFDSSGFSIKTEVAAGGGREVAWLAIEFSDLIEVDTGTHNTPTSTGDESQTGAAETPQCVLLAPTIQESVGFVDDLNAGSRGLGAFDATRESCVSATSEDGVATTNTQSATDALALDMYEDDGTLSYAASFVSMDAAGFTLNYSTVHGVAKKVAWLSFGDGLGPPATGIPRIIGGGFFGGIG